MPLKTKSITKDYIVTWRLYNYTLSIIIYKRIQSDISIMQCQACIPRRIERKKCDLLIYAKL